MLRERLGETRRAVEDAPSAAGRDGPEAGAGSLGSTGMVDLRLANKPPTGVRSDQQWPSRYSSYLSAILPSYVDLPKRAESPEEDVANAALGRDEV